MKLARRILFVSGMVALVIAGLVAVFYGIEDWRGAQAWADCQRDLKARGESIDVASFIPPPVSDDENLGMAPFFVRLYGYRVDPFTRALTFPSPSTPNALKDEINAMPRGIEMPGISAPKSAGDWSTGHSLDLAAWQQYYRGRPDFPHPNQAQTPAEDVLLALTKYDPILTEVAQAAAARPKTRFPVNWNDPMPARIALPHYNALQNLTSALRLRATANLVLGKNDAAMRDLALARRFIGIAADDPNLIAQLVSMTETGIAMQPIWEGLKARRWSYPELEQIKTGLGGLDYLAGFRRAIRGDRVLFMCKMADYYKRHSGSLPVIVAGETAGKPQNIFNIIGVLFSQSPGGWYDQNKAIGCRYCQDNLIDAVDAKAHHVWLAKVKVGDVVAQSMTMTPYTWLVRIGAPVFASVLMRAVAYQADVDHAIIACALEQFFLDHHTYPGRLNELVPAYLNQVPTDVIDGEPTRYRMTSDGRYILYSVGWDGRDDDGQIAWQKESVRRDNNRGDWVWQYQPLQPPPEIQRSR